MVDNEKYTVDYNEMAHFKGIRILFEHLEEGLDHAQKNGIKEVCVWTDGDWSKQIVSFDFLAGRDFIETFHWLVPMSKKSNVRGLKNLTNLRNLRWSAAGDFDLDFSDFQYLEEINFGYGKKIKGWEYLTKIRRLQIAGLKTEDLSLLNQARNLEYLRIIGGSFSTIRGIEECQKIRTLFLQKCTQLKEIRPIISKLQNLEQLNLEGCKSIDDEKELAGVAIKHVSIVF